MLSHNYRFNGNNENGGMRMKMTARKTQIPPAASGQQQPPKVNQNEATQLMPPKNDAVQQQTVAAQNGDV